MSGEIINLRMARKQRAKANREAVAAQNRRKFGRTKTERRLAEAEAQLAERRLDGARLATATSSVRHEGDTEAATSSDALPPDTRDQPAASARSSRDQDT